jgi:integrase
MASIKRRGNAWRARYRDDSGREHAGHFPTRIKAQQWIDQQTAGLVTGQWVDPKAGRVTFREYAEQWRQTQVHRDSTGASIEQHLRLHVYPTIGDRPLRSILPSDVQALVRHLSDPLAASTVHVVYGRVAAVFRAAVRDRLIASSPCVDVKRPSAPSPALEVLSTEQVFALAQVVPERYAALVLAGAGTGLRPGELFGLAIDRVDFLRRTVKVDQQLVRVRGGVELGPVKTPSSYRTVPLPSSVGDALAAHLARWPAHPELGVVFTNVAGEPVRRDAFAAVFERGRGVAGIPSWATPHDLRHYYASLLIRQGLSVKAVQQRLGHASAKTTLDTYGKLWPDDDDRTRDAVDAEFRILADSPRTAEVSTP